MKFYLTTPLYYLNAEPHIGHAYTTVIADILCRYYRMAGYDVLLLTGTDEHGEKVAQSASARGKTPLEHCDEFVEKFKRMWEILNVKYDDFIRTTEPRHIRVVERALQMLYEKGEIYKADYEGWYCVPDERFWTEKELVNGKCPACGREVIKLKESNYFFRMGKHQDWLINWIESHPDFIRPAIRRNEVLGFLKKPLNDLCISRPKSRLSWGIPLPFDRDYVCYVWVDALLNYVSAVGFTVDEHKFRYFWPADCHLIGKDILTTHAVYWPILLHALEVEPPRMIFAHGWWMIKEAKMGKSLGNAVNPGVLVREYGVDQIRYFLARDMSFGYDASFSFDLLEKRINSELADDIGNLFQRTIAMVHRYLDGIIPAKVAPGSDEVLLKKFATDSVAKIEQSILDLDPTNALELSINVARETNKFIEKTAPWNLHKKNEKEQLSSILYTALEILRKLAIIYYPVMPDKCERMRIMLRCDEPITFESAKIWGLLRSGERLGEPISLFPKREKQIVIEERKDENEMETKAQIGIEEFSRVDLRVGVVKEAELVEGTKKLLKLKVDIGEEIRTLVAGLAHIYPPQSLIGKRIIVVANLKPATIKGVQSNGMLLAAQDGSSISILTTDKEITPGAKVS